MCQDPEAEERLWMRWIVFYCKGKAELVGWGDEGRWAGWDLDLEHRKCSVFGRCKKKKKNKVAKALEGLSACTT